MTSLKATGRLLIHWAEAVFGSVARNPRERGMRMIEECLEFAQTMGVNQHDAAKIVVRVWSRNPGLAHVEAGQAFLTLLQAAAVMELELHEELNIEIQRVTDPAIVERLRASHAAKVIEGTATK